MSHLLEAVLLAKSAAKLFKSAHWRLKIPEFEISSYLSAKLLSVNNPG
jgi:hypothetical protein